MHLQRPLLTLGLLCWMLVACDLPTAKRAAEQQPLSQIPLGKINLDPSSRPQHDAKVLRLDLTAWLREIEAVGIRPLLLPQEKDAEALVISLKAAAFEPTLIFNRPPLRSSDRLLTQGTASFSLGSGFVSSTQASEPVGLLRIKDEDISPLLPHGYTRILAVRDGALQIFHRDDERVMQVPQAMQLGPGIVENGLLDINQRELRKQPYHRAALGLCETPTELTYLLVISLKPIHLYRLGQLLLDQQRVPAWRCREVVNFAGDREAFLGVKTPDGLFYVGHPKRVRMSLLAFSTGG